MASTDAVPIPRKNVAVRIEFPIRKSDGTLIIGATGLDSEISKDGGTFADCVNEATEILAVGGVLGSGFYYLDITATENNADAIAVQVKTTSTGAIIEPFVWYPQEDGDIRVNVIQWGSSAVNALVSGRVDASIGAVATGAIAAASFAANALDAVWSTTTRAITDKAGFSLSSAGVQAIWDALTSAFSTSGSIGKLIKDFLDAAVSSRSTYAGSDTSGTTTLLGRLTASRAGYLDNLNTGSIVATQADINALNQSASRRIILLVLPSMERPESGTVVYQVKIFTYDGDGASVDADSTPILTVTGNISGSLAANLSSSSHTTTGEYTWDYTVHSSDTNEQLIFNASATISSSVFNITAYSQIQDLVASPWTSSDRAVLLAIQSIVNQFIFDGSSYVKADVEAMASTVIDAIQSGLSQLDSSDIIALLGTYGVAKTSELPAEPHNAEIDNINDIVSDLVEVNMGLYRFTSAALFLTPLVDISGVSTFDPIIDKVNLNDNQSTVTIGEVLTLPTSVTDQIEAAVDAGISANDDIQQIKAKTALITADNINVIAPTDVYSNEFTIIRGDDYTLESDRVLPQWSSDDWSVYSLSTAQSIMIKLKTKYSDEVTEKEMSVASDTSVFAQFTSAETSEFALGTHAYIFDVSATLSGGDIVTLVRGYMNVVDDVR